MEDIEIVPCMYCGRSGVEFQIVNRVCLKCLTEQKAEAKAKRTVKFAEACPILYQTNDKSRLPNIVAYENVQRWVYGPRGLLLAGDTRKGKTRALWALIRRVYVDEGKRYEFFDGPGFSAANANAYREEDHEEWIDRMERVPVFVLDDLDKCTFSESAQTELFGIVERRVSNHKPIMVSTNVSDKTLAARMSTVGEPLVRRLREFCEVIKF